MMQTGESMQSKATATRLLYPHTLWFVRCWGIFQTLGARCSRNASCPALP